jgi:hypothetical protein
LTEVFFKYRSISGPNKFGGSSSSLRSLPNLSEMTRSGKGKKFSGSTDGLEVLGYESRDHKLFASHPELYQVHIYI